MKNLTHTKAIEVEKKRLIYAKQHKYLELRDLYNKRLPEIRDNNTSKLWDQLNTEFSSIKNNYMAEDRVKHVARLVKGNHIKVLNIGVGTGNLENIYFKKSYTNTVWEGVDISPQSIKIAASKFKSAKFSVGDILKLKSRNNSYDYVIALEVLEHIKPCKIFTALGEIHRVLKNKGKLIISVPLNEGLEEMLEKGFNPNAHVRIYQPQLIDAELKIAGFKSLDIRLLYAFSKYYKLKTFITIMLSLQKKPNNIIILSYKDN